MDLLTQLLLGMGAFSLIVVVGSFVGIMMVVIEDTIEERQQARERNKRRNWNGVIYIDDTGWNGVNSCIWHRLYNFIDSEMAILLQKI